MKQATVRQMASCIVLALSTATLSAQSPGSGQINGTVHLASGAPVPNAIVSLSAPAAGRGMRSNVNVKTGPSGAFTLASVLPGSYQVCVQAPDRQLLDPCKWSPRVVTV